MTDTILVVGGGVAGLHAAEVCTAGGARVCLVEREPVVGGRLAATMTAEDGVGDRAEGERVPLFAALDDNESIEILTNASLVSLSGGPGNFDATIAERARFVTDACTRCKLCHTACPVVLANEFDAGLTFRKAIYTPLPETLPSAYVIDIDSCLNTPPNYLPCNRCVEVCDDDAIHFDMALTTRRERHVGAVILAPGFRLSDSAAYADLGYGIHPDIVTSAELQRLMEVPGPTGGFATRPSNEEYPDSVLLVVDALSSFALYIVASQVRQLIAQDIGTVAVLALSPPEADTAASADALADATGVSLGFGAMFAAEAADDGRVSVSYEDLSSRRFVKAAYELVVLCTDVEPPTGLDALAAASGIALGDDGYVAATVVDEQGVATDRDGVFVAGCASGPKSIKASLDEAGAAAAAALAALDPRLLQAERDAESPMAVAAPGSPPDELQQRIEKLLYALIDTGSAP